MMSARTVPKSTFGAFMRSRGLKIFYPIFVILSSITYISYLTEDVSRKSILPRYAWYQTLWINCFRVGGIFLFFPILTFMYTYLFARLPPVTEGPDTDVKIGEIEKSIYSNNNNEYVKNGAYVSKTRIACFIIRIITRGDYPKLIRKSVAWHIDLIERYCRCDRLEVHIVTEKQLDGSYEIGQIGKVVEILVPSTYKPSNGTLYKAKNMAYWMENYSNEFDYPPFDRTWILSLDEDSFISASFMDDFCRTFLPSGAHMSVSPSLFELPSITNWRNFGDIANGFEESMAFTIITTGIWLEGATLKTTPLWTRGSAFVVRRDVEKKIGYNYPPELSIGEDHTFATYFADSGYKIGYINGWNWEGGAPSLLGLIKQRARWFRAHMYAFLYQPTSIRRRCRAGVQMFYQYVICSICMMCAISGTCCVIINRADLIIPAGPRLWPWDYLAPFVFSHMFYANIYGAWHIMSTRKAAWYTLATCLWFGIPIAYTVHVASLVWTIVTLIGDSIQGRQCYEVTVKKKN